MLEHIAQRAPQGQALDRAPGAHELIGREGVIDALDGLFDDRPFVEVDGSEMRGRADQLDAARVPVREGAELVDANGRKVGVVTSGGFGPTLEAPVAMGYVETALAKPGTQLAAMVRGKPVPVEVASTPFVPQRYYRG